MISLLSLKEGGGQLGSLLGAYIVPEFLSLILGEVSSDADMVDADSLDEGIYGISEIFDRRIPSGRKKPIEGGSSDDPSSFGEELKGLVSLVSGDFAVAAGVGVCNGDRLARILDRLDGRSFSTVGKIDEDAETVHFAHRVDPEIAQPIITSLIASIADEVALVKSELDDEDSKRTEQLNAPQIILDRRRVLPTQNDTHSTIFFSLQDVLNRSNLADHISPFIESDLPLRDVIHRLLEVLPRNQGCVDRRQATHPQALKDSRTVPIAYVEGVNDDGIVI